MVYGGHFGDGVVSSVGEGESETGGIEFVCAKIVVDENDS